MGFWAAAAPYIATAVGALLSSKGSKKQSQQEQMSIQFSERARREALANLSNYAVYGTGSWLFPGALSRPTSAGVQGTMPGPGDRTYQAQPGLDSGPIQPRAAGGPVLPNQDYLVGERGPETLSMGPPGAGGQVTPLGANGPASAASRRSPTRNTRGLSNAPGVGGPMTGATATAPPAPSFSTPGEGIIQWINQFLQKPGEISSVGYERAQEQANLGERASLNQIGSGFLGQGVDPNSPMGQSLAQSATLNSQAQRNEAARDFTLAQEQQKRADIDQATQSFMAVLSQILGLQQARASAASGGGFSPVNASNPYAGAAGAISLLGYQIAQSNAKKNEQQPAP